MAGWLAWNLRILSSALIACCSYYGINYLHKQDRQKNIEKINFQDQEESDGVKNLKLGEENPTIVREYIKKTINSQNIPNFNEWINDKIKSCKESPYLYISDNNDLHQRRYCRLYWSVKDSIDILIKTENKLILLSPTSHRDDQEWKNKWEEYKETSPWGEITPREEETVPNEFKVLCEKKSKELIYFDNDNAYRSVTKFCTRRKTVEDVLNEGKFRLLKTENSDDDTIWENKFSEYKQQNNSEKFWDKPNVTDKSILKRECKKTVELKTYDEHYQRSRSVAKRYCAIAT